MTPLEQLLAERPEPEFRGEFLHRLTARFLPAVGAAVDRKIWPSSLRHMRWVAPGYRFYPTETGGWTMCNPRGNPAAIARPLREITPQAVRPVTIFATGPSALDTDWVRLGDGSRFIVAVNGATTVLAEHGVRPDLHVVIDRKFTLSGMAHMVAAPGVPLVATYRVATILDHCLPGFFAEKPLAVIERVNSWYGIPRIQNSLLRDLNVASGKPFHFPEAADEKCSIGWSDAPQLGIFSGFTVVFSALQIAVFLGARDIEIVGMDLSATGRAYQEGSRVQPTGLVADYEKYILPSFQIMHRALAGRDLAVRNLSPVCPLPKGLFAVSTG